MRNIIIILLCLVSSCSSAPTAPYNENYIPIRKNTFNYQNVYNSKGNLISVEKVGKSYEMGDSSNFIIKTVFFYDNQDSLIRTEDYSKDTNGEFKKIIQVTTYIDHSEICISYHDYPNDTLSFTKKATVPKMNVFYFEFNDIDSHFSSSKSAKRKSNRYEIFDENNRLIKVKKHDLIDNSMQIIKYEYKNLLDTLFTKAVNENNQIEVSSKKFTSNNFIIQVDYNIDNSIDSTYYLKEKGVRKVSYNNNAPISINTYEYDKNGNLTKIEELYYQ